MNFSVTLGWWLAPLAITVLAIGLRGWVHRDEPAASGYGVIGQGIGRALTGAAVLVVSLVAWLVWALLK